MSEFMREGGCAQRINRKDRFLLLNESSPKKKKEDYCGGGGGELIEAARGETICLSGTSFFILSQKKTCIALRRGWRKRGLSLSEEKKRTGKHQV